MKIIQSERIIDAGPFSQSAEWHKIEGHIFQAIQSIEWPPDSGSFTLRKESGKKRGQGSGVTPIKKACMQKLQSFGWQLETPVDIATVRRPGPMDATYRVNRLPFLRGVGDGQYLFKSPFGQQNGLGNHEENSNRGCPYSADPRDVSVPHRSRRQLPGAITIFSFVEILDYRRGLARRHCDRT